MKNIKIYLYGLLMIISCYSLFYIGQFLFKGYWYIFPTMLLISSLVIGLGMLISEELLKRRDK